MPRGVRNGVPPVSVDNAGDGLGTLIEGRWSLLAAGEEGAGVLSCVADLEGGFTERSRSRTYIPSNLGLVG